MDPTVSAQAEEITQLLKTSRETILNLECIAISYNGASPQGPALRATNHTWNTIVDDLNEIVSELKEKLEDLIIAGAAAAEGAKAKAELETKVSRLEEEVLRLREEVKTEMGRAERLMDRLLKGGILDCEKAKEEGRAEATAEYRDTVRGLREDLMSKTSEVATLKESHAREMGQQEVKMMEEKNAVEQKLRDEILSIIASDKMETDRLRDELTTMHTNQERLKDTRHEKAIQYLKRWHEEDLQKAKDEASGKFVEALGQLREQMDKNAAGVVERVRGLETQVTKAQSVSQSLIDHVQTWHDDSALKIANSVTQLDQSAENLQIYLEQLDPDSQAISAAIEGLRDATAEIRRQDKESASKETRLWNLQVDSLQLDLEEVSTQLRKDRDALHREIGKNQSVDSLITQLQRVDLSGIQQLSRPIFELRAMGQDTLEHIVNINDELKQVQESLDKTTGSLRKSATAGLKAPAGLQLGDDTVDVETSGPLGTGMFGSKRAGTALGPAASRSGSAPASRQGMATPSYARQTDSSKGRDKRKRTENTPTLGALASGQGRKRIQRPQSPTRPTTSSTQETSGSSEMHVAQQPLVDPFARKSLGGARPRQEEEAKELEVAKQQSLLDFAKEAASRKEQSSGSAGAASPEMEKLFALIDFSEVSNEERESFVGLVGTFSRNADFFRKQFDTNASGPSDKKPVTPRFCLSSMMAAKKATFTRDSDRRSDCPTCATLRDRLCCHLRYAEGVPDPKGERDDNFKVKNKKGLPRELRKEANAEGKRWVLGCRH